METIILDTNIYSLRSILSATFVFLDDYYIFLDQAEEGKIAVQIKSKEKEADLKKAVDDFKNELINTSLRLKISKENKKIREAIVSSALYGRVEELKTRHTADPEGICIKWEEANNKASKDSQRICESRNNNRFENITHRGFNRSCVNAQKPNYTKMFKSKENGDKSQ